jgi:hypothetical protein
VLRRFVSDAPVPALPAERYFAAGWVKPASALAATPGMHRFVWDLRLPRPRAIRYSYSIAAVWGRDTPLEPRGARVLPGRYTVELQADGQTLRRHLLVTEDPRVHATPADLRALFDFQQQLAGAMARSYAGAGQVQALQRELDALRPQLAGHAAVQAASRSLGDALAPPHGAALQARYVRANAELAALATDANSADRAPTAAQRAVYAEARAAIATTDADWQRVQHGPLPVLNAALHAAQLPPLSVPPAASVRVIPGPEGADLP